MAVSYGRQALSRCLIPDLEVAWQLQDLAEGSPASRRWTFIFLWRLQCKAVILTPAARDFGGTHPVAQSHGLQQVLPLRQSK